MTDNKVLSQEELDKINALLKSCDDLNEEIQFQEEEIDFLLNEWKTNKRYFRDEPGRVTTEDVIKAVFHFAWGSRGNFDHMLHKRENTEMCEETDETK